MRAKSSKQRCPALCFAASCCFDFTHCKPCALESLEMKLFQEDHCEEALHSACSYKYTQNAYP